MTPKSQYTEQDYLNAMVDNYQGKQRNSGLQERLNGFYGGL